MNLKKRIQGLIILSLLIFSLSWVWTASAACSDGTPGGDSIDCDTNPGGADQTVEGLGGNDTITTTNTVTAGGVTGDGDGAGGLLPGDGGNDTLTNDGTVDFITGDGVTNNGGGDTITNNNQAVFISGDDADGDGGNDTITNNGLTLGIAGDDSSGNGGNDTITNNGVALIILGDASLTNGGSDTITNNGIAVMVSGDGANGDGGSDTIVNSGLTLDIVGDDVFGNGGNDLIINTGTASTLIGDGASGDGGDDIIVNNGTTDFIVGDNAFGSGGDDLIVNNGIVTLDILAEDGDDQVIIRVGSTVSGIIDGGNHTLGDTITFADTTAAIQAIIEATCTPNCPGGVTVNIGGTNYTYVIVNFESIAFIAAAIAQQVQQSEVSTAPTGPQEICGGAIKVFRLANGDLQIYSGFDVLPPNGFLVAYIPQALQQPGSTFTDPNAPIQGWSVRLGEDGRISVFDAQGHLISDSCYFRA